MFKFLTGLTETVVKVATLPVSVVVDSTFIPFMLDKSMTEENIKSIGKSIDKMGEGE